VRCIAREEEELAMVRARARLHGTRRRRLLPEHLEERCLLSAESLPSIVIQPTHVLRAAAAVASAGFSPDQVRQAYGFDQVQFSGVTGDGSGQTIAIVDAFDDPVIASDLHVFDQQFGFADPPSFTKIYASGVAPRTDSGWAVEIALDVQWAHAIAPGANIVLVEARSDSLSDLLTAVDVARNLPSVSVISMSWGGSEFAGETSYDNVFTTPAGHQGITFVAAAGDQGAGAIWPAASPNVVSVGGTSLTASNGNYLSESAWSGSGGGQSLYESEPAFQAAVQSSGVRTVPDVAYDADPSTGFAVYDSLPASRRSPGGWLVVGGTSAGAPQWAALTAIVDQGRAAVGNASLANLQSLLYQVPASDFHDIYTGSNGLSATAGYDLVTGRGSPIANLLIADLVGLAASSGSGGASSGGGSSSGSAPGLPTNLSGVARALTHSAEYFATFIKDAYNTYLGRAPDAQGLAWWTGRMQAGVTDEQLEAALTSSSEFVQQSGGTDPAWVEAMYTDLLERAPDLDGLSYWVSQLQLGASRYQIALHIAASVEREAMVVQNDYFAFLGRDATSQDITFWVARFSQGAENEDIVAGFIASPEYYNGATKGQGSRSGWLDSAYQDLFQRLPGGSEASYWLLLLG
jgi:hypothetical protein